MAEHLYAIKAVSGPTSIGANPLLSADRTTLFTEKTQILQRRADHFRGVLNRPSAISEVAIAPLNQVKTSADLNLAPSLYETIKAVQQLFSGKALGSDATPAEIYKHRGPKLMDNLTALFQEMWRQVEVPQDFKDATIVHLYKRKGNRQLCDNHRGISLLNITVKIFARMLLNRLNNHLEQGKGASPLLSADRTTLFTGKTQILQRRADHYRGVLNRLSAISDVAIAPLHQVETSADLDLAPSIYETMKAVQQLSSGKAPGWDATPAEIYKHSGPQLMDYLTALFQEEKCQEIRVHLYSAFEDLTKAFDTINREGLRKRIQKFGCPDRFTQVTARVTDNGVVSGTFAMTNGAKQGCALSPTLFTLMFSAMLMDTYHDERPGIRVAYRTDSQLFNQRRMKCRSLVSANTVHELLSPTTAL
ncbi:hypothetical protein SprV_0401473200 [Sparganum proliferum]